MSYYGSPEEMFRARTRNCKQTADWHWAMAKAGEGDFHYGKAKSYYEQAAANREKANQAKANSATF